MSKEKKLKSLFYSHLTDLKSVIPEIGDVFICPICFNEFIVADIYNKKLSDGHVWPDYIREKSSSRVAARQRVLLCTCCNNTAGSRGDKQMQLREEIKDSDKVGKIHGERRVQIIPKSGEKPINLRATIINIASQDKMKGRITFEVDKRTGQGARINPKEQEKFLSIAAQGERFSMLVHPHDGLKTELPRAGWITSAYLLAFYTFGYRYIFNSFLNPLREYILASIDKKMQEKLQFPASDVISWQECKEHFYKNPEIGLVIPTDGKLPVHLEISFLDYHIGLPFHGSPHVLHVLISSKPNIDQLLKSAQKGAYFYIPIGCNKSDIHECLWDYILGKPIPT